MTDVVSAELCNTKLRVAIVDVGIDGAAEQLRQVLLSAAQVELVSTQVDAATAGADRVEPADIVIVTWGGGIDMTTAVGAARRVAPDAALIMVVPWYDEVVFLSAIRMGAQDCITASQIDGPGLMRSLLLAAERNRMTSTLRTAALTDELTGLFNRRGYIFRAATLLKATDPKLIWQIFFDVDDLKQVNDTFGHWAGDRALIEVAGALKQAFRASDIVARVGGDEFAVLALAPADAPPSWTTRWREPFAELSARREFPLSVSVGVAQPDEHRHMTPEELLTRADTTMYTAKRLRKKLADAQGSAARDVSLAEKG